MCMQKEIQSIRLNYYFWLVEIIYFIIIITNPLISTYTYASV